MKDTDKPGSNVMQLRQPDPMNVHIGKRITIGRRMVEVTQETIAEALGVTYQQVQKYESGRDRVPAVAIARLSDALNLPVMFFYDGFVDDTPESQIADAGKSFQFLDTFASTKEGLRLINAFIRIDDQAIRTEIITLAEACAARLAVTPKPEPGD